MSYDVHSFTRDHVRPSTPHTAAASPDATAATPGPDATADGGAATPTSEQPKQELATFRLLYETSRLCLFETRDGRITAVPISRLA